ncbi:hypothetical protein, partial [Pseudomonas sp.]|uniref:hypothetical protein n=2 Tax=Pseudomonas TaxID=286 RepID=UPI003FD7C525
LALRSTSRLSLAGGEFYRIKISGQPPFPFFSTQIQHIRMTLSEALPHAIKHTQQYLPDKHHYEAHTCIKAVCMPQTTSCGD